MKISEASDCVEAVSRAYERIFGIERTDDWLALKLHEEVGELAQAYLGATGRSRHPEAAEEFGQEIADVLAHLLLLARRFGVDPAAELERKWFAFRDVVEPGDCAGLAVDALGVVGGAAAADEAGSGAAFDGRRAARRAEGER